MGFLTNQWVRYIDRSYQQIKENTITNMQAKVPEITDHTEGNIFVKMVSIWAGISEMLGYYVDSTGREIFLDSARLYKNKVKIARSYDYRIRASSAATVNLQFTLNAAAPSNVTVPAGTICETAEGIKFKTLANLVITTGNTIGNVTAEQVELLTNVTVGNSNGQANQEFVLPDNVVDKSVVVRINSIAWESQETFAYSYATAQFFQCNVNELGQPIIRFGDGFLGEIPTNTLAIVTDYKVTRGEEGNVTTNTIVNILTPIVLPPTYTIAVTNPERASGGSGIETGTEITRNVPLASRTKYRAVTLQDYIDVTELVNGVAKAGVNFVCGKKVNIYVVPVGGGVASNALLSAVGVWLDERKMITTQLAIFTAGEVRILLEITLRVKPQYVQSEIVTNVTNNLTTFLSFLNQSIGGSVRISDIYAIIENTEGVDYSSITLVSHVPYAFPDQVTMPSLNWSREVKSGSVGEVSWTITMLSPTTFRLMRENVLVANYTVGSLVSLTELDFTVNAGAYVANDKWSFKTYKYNDSLILNEPSLPVSLSGDITINASGGI